MKQCMDCKYFKNNLQRGPRCINDNRKEKYWTSIAACSSYIRKWYKFWRIK